MRTFWRDKSGNMAVLFAMGFTVSALLSAVAIDTAALYHEQRILQNAVDLAALTAVRNPQRAQALAQSALVEAGLLAPEATAGLRVEPGRYERDPDRAVNARFTPGGTPFNAVAVTFHRQGRLHFAQGWAEPPLLGARAVASMTPEVAFSLGSRLLALEGGLINLALNRLLGSKVTLSVLDYRGLAGLKLDMFAFLDALAGEMNVTAGSYDDLLKLTADRGQIIRALAGLADGTQRRILHDLLTQADKASITLDQLLKPGRLGSLAIGSAGARGVLTQISALDLLAASATLSNGIQVLDLPLSGSIAGLASAQARLVIGEPMQESGWMRIGPVGAMLRTAQVRLRLLATVGGKGALLGETIRLPLYLEIAHAEAMVAAATCPEGKTGRGTATLLVRPGALRLLIGEVSDSAQDNFSTPPKLTNAKLVEVKLLGLTLLQVLGSSEVELAQTKPITLDFSSADIAAARTRTARITTLASGLVATLFNRLNLQVPIAGLGLNLSTIGPLLGSIIMPLAPALDLALNQLLGAVGLSLGEADVTVHGVRCGAPALVG